MKILKSKALLLLSIYLVIIIANPCSKNCADCGGDESVCYACQPGTELTVLSKCVTQTTIDKCVLYSPTSTCFVCQPTYQLQNGKCVKDLTGCLNVLDGACTECGFGTILDAGKCVGSINCKKNQKVCSQCLPGYTLKNGKCVPNQGCKIFDQASGVCKECALGFNFVGFRCLPASKIVYDCYIWNENQECQNCKYGFIPYENQCLLPDDIQEVQTGSKTLAQIIAEKKVKFEAVYGAIQTHTQTQTITQPQNQPQPQILKIDNCKIVDQGNKICALCEDRFYRSVNKCLAVNNLCKDYDSSNGKCTSCNSGFSLADGACVKIVIQPPTQQPTSQPPSNTQQTTSQPSNQQQSTSGGVIPVQPITQTTDIVRDPNCLKLQGTKCTKCSQKYYISINDGKCLPVNPLCQASNERGACTSCFKGYKLAGDNCVPAIDKDPFCKQTDKTGVCTKCFDGYYLGQSVTCQPLNPLCKSSDLTNGKCTACYQGYTLSQGTCKVFVRDPSCIEYDQSGNCNKCPPKFYLSQGSCRQVSPLCKDYDKTSGQCTDCYSGYVLSKGFCNFATSQTDDLNCKQKKDSKCVSCYSGYYLNSATGKCTIMNLLCKTTDTQTGACLTCYDGYTLASPTCKPASSETADIYCKKFDQKNKRLCVQCYGGYFIATGTGLCTLLDSTCKQTDKATGACTSCYGGYNLISGKCVYDTPATSVNTDQFCIKLDGAKCLECNKGYFVAANNVCTKVDDSCKTYNMQTGDCLTCLSTLILSGGRCISPQQVYIPFCLQVNAQGKCVQCQNKYYLLNEGCTLIPNTLCDTYNKTNGKCLTCSDGYVLQADDCIYPSFGVDPGCAWYTNSYCTQCKPRYYLESYRCYEVDSRCTDFDYSKNVCNVCANSVPQGPYCA